jgi:hypothetical protein
VNNLTKLEQSVLAAIRDRATDLAPLGLDEGSAIWTAPRTERYPRLCAVLRELGGDEAVREATNPFAIMEASSAAQRAEDEEATTRPQQDKPSGNWTHGDYPVAGETYDEGPIPTWRFPLNEQWCEADE